MEDNLNIYGVDFQMIAYLATNLSRIANEYRSKIASIYKTFNNLGVNQKWTGKNFNFIAMNVFNNFKYAVEDWIDYLQFTVPLQIYQIALFAQNGDTESQIEFLLYKSTDEIKYIEETEENIDGAFKIEEDIVRSEVNDNISSYCIQSNNLIDDYKTQVDELLPLSGQINIEPFIEEIDEIVYKNKSYIRCIENNLQEIFEKTIDNIHITEQEAIDIAGSIENITG